MRVFFITNLAPSRENPYSGIFITKRLKEYKRFGIVIKAVPLVFEDSGKLIKLVRSLLKKVHKTPLENLENVSYEPVFVEITIFDIFFYIWSKRKILEKFTTSFVDKILKKFDPKYTVIHAHGMYLPAPAGIVAKRLSAIWDVPYVVTLHGSDINLDMKIENVRDTFVETLENASKCIFVSNSLLEKAKSFGYSGENAVVIPNGYDPDVFKPLDKEKTRKKLGIHKEGYRYVGFVGNLIPIKRADKLPEIFRYIRREIPDTFFIVVGDGYLREKIERETRGLDILFTGRVPQEMVAEYMNAMDVMILPSRSEGWPCVVLEAQACGTCAVGSSNGGIPEAIGFDEHIVEEGRDFVERFAQKVVKILEKGYDRNSLIERAKNFTWKEIVKKEIDIIRHC